MKKLGAIIFGIVFILGLSIVTAPAQEVETVDPDGVVSSSGGWWPDDPVYEDFNDWGTNPDEDFASVYDQGNVTVAFDLKDLTEGPFTAIKVKLRAGSWAESYLHVVPYAGGERIGDSGDEWYFTVNGNFDDYEKDWTGLNMTKDQLAGLEVEIKIGDTWEEQMDISAIQVELTPEVVAPPDVTDPIHVTIDYRPYRSSNPLNYRSRGKVRVVIFGADDFDVRQIDRESVLLAGVVAPVRHAQRIRKIYSRTDGARDEHEDLVLMFKAQQVIEALEKSLERELKNRDEVNLVLTGNLKDDTATPFEGEDEATVFGKRHKRKNEDNWKNYLKWWKEKRHQREKD
jgi:hypothetical protein